MKAYSHLGALREKDQWIFRVFSTRDSLELLIYPDPEGDDFKKYQMKKIGEVYQLILKGDLAGLGYCYRYEDKLIVDPYAKYVSKGARRGILVEDRKSDPEGFRSHRVPKLDERKSIVYEHHVDDFSKDKLAGFKYPGKFLSLCESFANEWGLRGSDYIASLGVTHLHLLPITPIISLGEDEEAYNWGYDPEYYFALHRGYLLESTRPHQALGELKRVIMHLHSLGLGLVVDVVYNHTYRTLDSSFEALAPGYYYRMEGGSFTDGSGCGNELDTSRSYVRRLIKDSLIYWLEEFRVDGFRFDLWGLMEEDFALEIVESLKKINPQVLIYGEPWASGDKPKNALNYGSQRGRGFSLFNDRFRDGLRGKNDDRSHGYVQGSIRARNHVLTGIVGDINFSEGIYGPCEEPWETLSYMSCHDNLILYDKLKFSTGEDDSLIRRRTALGFSIQLLSFGNVFIQAGTEFMRTKNMNRNSYKSDCMINCIKWEQLEKERELIGLVRGLIALRKKFKLEDFNADGIRDRLLFYPHNPMIYLEIDLGEEELFIGHNPTLEKQSLPISHGKYFLQDFKVNLLGEEKTKTTIAPLESVVFTRRKNESLSY